MSNEPTAGDDTTGDNATDENAKTDEETTDEETTDEEQEHSVQEEEPEDGRKGRGYKDRVEEAIDETFETWQKEREEANKARQKRREARGESGHGEDPEPGEFSWKRVNVEAYVSNEHARKEDEWGTDYPGVEFGQTHGKTPASSEFLRETQGDISDGLRVGINRFLTLPPRVVKAIIRTSPGGLTWGDSVRMDVPIVSYLAGFTAEQPGGKREVEYEHGETVVIPDGQVVVSMQTVARALYERFRFCPTKREAINSNKDFTAFYRSVTRAFSRLTDRSVLAHHGPAVETGDKTSDAYGQRYSVNVPQLSSFPLGSETPPLSTAAESPIAPAGSYVDTFALRLEDGREVVDVPAMFDQLVREHTGQWSTFTEQAVKSTTASRDPTENFRTKESGVAGFSWQRRQAQPSTVGREDDQENSRHVTTGAYKSGHSTRGERAHIPCAIPFFVLEIDGETPQSCVEYARRITRWLKGIGVPLKSVTVTYTGNQSFHIRLPAGLFGKPIFRSTREATRTIRELYSMIEEKVGRPGSAHVDGALASPLHHIRAIGSVHEGLYSKEGTTRYCVGFTAEQVLRFPLGAIREFSARYDGYTLPRPGEASIHQGLHDLLTEACERAQATGEMDEDRSSSAGIFEEIYREGVEEGEEFAPGLIGRNLAARIVSLNLLQSGCSTQDAWLALREWNEKNSPPLGESPGDATGELRYVFERAQNEEAQL